MLCVLLHGGDLSGWAWLFILFVLALAGAAVIAAFVGVLYLISRRWPALKTAAPDGLKTERTPND